eukprot:CAMPEP_0194262378 /NCGR_PEP_ID=MMETSP0158-20130606/46511_1 /TAXON_ID=33649 /ORGANISM="Thalassionema nitzschioides, Strain L26-B" /LENGTH=598 /DNA_ID=CAMNT_0039002533 /DNA_START=147 /DNA_END=1943 /DNA_ORIENTATION=-
MTVRASVTFQLLLTNVSSSRLPSLIPNHRCFRVSPSFASSRNDVVDGEADNDSRWWIVIGGGAQKQRRFRSTSEKDGIQRMDSSNTTEISDITTKSSDLEERDANESKSSKESLSSSERPPSSQNNRMFRTVRKGVGSVISGVGFVASSSVSFVTDRRSLKERYGVPIEALRNFLKNSGVDMELSAALNRRLGTNICLLGWVHSFLGKKEKNIEDKRWPNAMFNIGPEKLSRSFWVEARRYMRYATAVYGQSMIRAAEVDARGRVDSKVGRGTKDVIGDHIAVPPEDIVLMDVDYDGDASHLRHFIAIDHEHKKVVLSIRGTFSLAEIVVDVAGFSREFCGGEAHSEMANMAEQVWRVAGPTVQQSLEENKGYEFIITGHSLGAGAASLLTILLQNKKLLPKSQKMRCFAYASPPVYTPLEHTPTAASITTNFIHENDSVPFLSVDSIRHLCTSLVSVDDFSHKEMTRSERYKVILGLKDVPTNLVSVDDFSHKEMTRSERYKVILGLKDVPTNLVEEVMEAQDKPVKPKEGAPVLYIPADKTVWLHADGDSEDGDYHYSTIGSRELVRRGIRVNPDMLFDHFPARYAHALEHVVEDF